MARVSERKFQLLQDKWYKRLAQDGFQDIEDTKSSKELIKVWHCSYFQKRYDPASFSAKRHYYELATQFLEAYHFFKFAVFFQYERQREIWEMHAQGVPLRHIARRFQTKVCRIHKLVKEFRHKMREYAS